MSVWKKVKVMERIARRESWKLPKHDRSKYIWYKLPYQYNRSRNHNFVFALTYLIEKCVRRFIRIYNIRIDFGTEVVGRVGSKAHAMKITVKVYFK